MEHEGQRIRVAVGEGGEVVERVDRRDDQVAVAAEHRRPLRVAPERGRQRAVHAGTGDLAAVVDYLAAQTRSRSIIPAPPHVTAPPAGPVTDPPPDR